MRNLKAVIFDWAGTILDHGCRAPIVSFLDLFTQIGIDLTEEEARVPMGLEKKDHLIEILRMPRIARQWASRHGGPPSAADIDSLFEKLLPIQARVLIQHSDVIPGATETIAFCRSRGLKIGSCTGYSAAAMQDLVASAAKGGLHLDAIVSPDEVGGGRPLPWMIFENMRRLRVYPPAAVVKVDDTAVGMTEGMNAGVWRVGVTLSGNGAGLSAQQLASLSASQRRNRADAAGETLTRAGAQFLVDSVANLPPILQEINQRLDGGERP